LAPNSFATSSSLSKTSKSSGLKNLSRIKLSFLYLRLVGFPFLLYFPVRNPLASGL
jgi:hypothetical protein